MIWRSIIAAHLGLLGLASLIDAPSYAEGPSLVADLANSVVEISYSFSGTQLLVFGAADCSAEQSPSPCHLIAVMEGPPQALVIRRKEKRSGLWINGATARYDRAPGYYAYAATAPLASMVPPSLVRTLGLGIDAALPAPSGGDKDLNAGFKAGLIEDRSAKGLFLEEPQAIIVREGRLFRMSFPAPATVPTGDYIIRIYSVVGGEVTAQTQQTLVVRKSGFEAFVTRAAQSHPLFYGIASIILALGIGFTSATLFNR